MFIFSVLVINMTLSSSFFLLTPNLKEMIIIIIKKSYTYWKTNFLSLPILTFSVWETLIFFLPPVFLMELEINTAFCLPPNLCTTIISAVSIALGIGLVYCFCITSRRSIGAENRFGLEIFLYLFFCPGPFIAYILMSWVLMWPILSIVLKWNIERLELAQGYVEFPWHIYHKKLVLLLCQSKASVSLLHRGSFSET